MLKELSGEEFQSWMAFYELEPTAGFRADYNTAHVVQALIRNGKPLGEFLLKFGDEVPAPAPPQDLKWQEMVIKGWCHGHNVALEHKQKKVG